MLKKAAMRKSTVGMSFGELYTPKSGQSVLLSGMTSRHSGLPKQQSSGLGFGKLAAKVNDLDLEQVDDSDNESDSRLRSNSISGSNSNVSRNALLLAESGITKKQLKA